MLHEEEWRQDFAGRKILIWGYGREGRASCALIRKVCPELHLDIAEARGKGEALLQKAGQEWDNVSLYTDDAVDFSAYDLILKSPGIVVPAGVPTEHISGESQLFLKHCRKQTIGVTGTKGKSTTTSVLQAMLAEKYRTHLVGNIGTAAFECLEELRDEDLVCYEISCHQLEFSHTWSPHVAVMLNLYPEHLDHYGTIERYRAAKQNVFRHQEPGDVVLLGAELTAEYAMRPDALRCGTDFGAVGKTLFIGAHRLDVSDCRLVGEHNYQNASYGYYIAHELYGVSDAQIQHALAGFEPLEHRLQDLGECDGVRWVNDSISTIGQAAIQALKAYPDTDTILIGGMDRGIPYDGLEDYLVARPELNVVFMYASGKRIYEEMKKQGRVRANMAVVADLKQAVEQGRQMTRPQRICLLSPAASSYDHFRNFEERGEAFRRLAFHLA